MARFTLDPNRLNFTIERKGKEYNLRVVQRAQAIFSTLLSILPSNYTSSIQGPNYTTELKAVAVEAAKIELALEDINLDLDYNNTRSEFLYSLVGYLCFLNNRLPSLEFDDREFRSFLLNLVKIYFRGSIPKSIEDAVGLFLQTEFQILENFLLVRDGSASFDISDQFGFQIDVATANQFPTDLFNLQSSIRVILDIIRPAHTLFDIRFIFTDGYDPNDEFGKIVDALRWDLQSYYYEDTRAYWDGFQNRDRLGKKTNKLVTAEIQTGQVRGAGTDTLYTNKGPISKPELSYQTGTTASISDFQTISMPSATITADDVGRYIRVTGSDAGTNDGVFRIIGTPSTTSVLVRSNFNLPDANDASISWDLFDPRHGHIADDPSDVTVRINTTPVVPLSVTGLRGEIVLPSTPSPADTIEVDYLWAPNPRVEVRGLNSTEFRLNAWNRDVGRGSGTGHHYRFNNVLLNPSEYDADDLGVSLEAPRLRRVDYKAFERAYTAVFNDPTKLLFNTPLHKIAYPPASRPLTDASVFYEGLTLPENDATSPWVRKGTGAAAVGAGTLTVTDNSTGYFPTGEPVFWTQALDLTFDHVFSAAWRFTLNTVTTLQGVWTGVAAGYSDDSRAYIVGFLDDSGVKKIGFLKQGVEGRFDDITSWTGGLDVDGNSTNAPVEFDWSILHSYRLFDDLNDVARLYVDGDVVASLQLTPAEAPLLKEVNAPFDEIQGAFFGSLSRVAESTSTWDFYRYLIQPTSPQQLSRSSIVSYEANVLPAVDSAPWTPVGFHGTESILSSDTLLLEVTSATDTSTSVAAGLIGGDFLGYTKIEPLLSSASQFSIEVAMKMDLQTHGVAPDGLVMAVDDGKRLTQLCFFPLESSPKLSYGGRSLPEDFSPFVWSSLGSQTASMVGRYLQIIDADNTDGLVYYIEDTSPEGSSTRVLAASIDYLLEGRLKVESYTVDGNNFAGVFLEGFDGTRAVGLQLEDDGGVYYVALQSEGVPLGAPARFVVNWNDGEYHTYRLRKSTAGDLVSLFVDGTFVGSAAYSAFTAPTPDPIGVVSFGSATAASAGALSTVSWVYCNSQQVATTQKRYMGVWKGYDNESLTGYHLPLKTGGVMASIGGNALEDIDADFVTAGVVSGDSLIIDTGANKGVYEVVSVVGSTTLTFGASFPSQPSKVSYRIALETDWSVNHEYRLSKGSSGSVTVYQDAAPLIEFGYTSLNLPPSSAGVVRSLTAGLPAVVFGSFSADNLVQSTWDFVRYSISSLSSDNLLVPPHQVINQWNLMSTNETQFFNSVTPIIPLTQSFENRAPYPTETYIAAFNSPSATLNSSEFIMNDGSVRRSLVVPDDVLYSSLKITETIEGDTENLRLKPFDDWYPELGALNFTVDTCQSYTADVLPESDTGMGWVLQSDAPGEVTTSVFAGALTYGTSAIGTSTAYLSNTPLPKAIGLQSDVTFRLKVIQDTSEGTGDTQIRFGLSARDLTVGLGFVTLPSGKRFVQAFDLGNGEVLGVAPVDYLDGNYHTYQLVRAPQKGLLEVTVDP